jgi:hypothetical protein
MSRLEAAIGWLKKLMALNEPCGFDGTTECSLLALQTVQNINRAAGFPVVRRCRQSLIRTARSIHRWLAGSSSQVVVIFPGELRRFGGLRLRSAGKRRQNRKKCSPDHCWPCRDATGCASCSPISAARPTISVSTCPACARATDPSRCSGGRFVSSGHSKAPLLAVNSRDMRLKEAVPIRFRQPFCPSTFSRRSENS